MVRGNSKLGGRGRGRKSADTTPDVPVTEQQDGFPMPAVPSSARNILPGEPFEPTSAGMPMPRSAETFAPGWGGGAPGLPGDPIGLNPLGFEPATGPLPTVNGAPGLGDPLDALQQYAGMPSAGTPGGYAPGAAPAPDPTQLYQPFQAPATASYPTAGTFAAPDGSGFADGGIFTGEAFGSDNYGSDTFGAPAFGGEPFDAAAHNPEPFGANPVLPAAPPAASTLLADPVFGGEAQPIGLPPLTAGPSTITPGAPFEPAPAFGSDSDLMVEEHSGRGRRRRNAKARRFTREHAADAPTSDHTPGNGSRRAVALLGIAAILGGAGYVGYTQLGGSEDEFVTSSPTTRTPAGGAASGSTATGNAAAKYVMPKQLAIFRQVNPKAAASLTTNYTAIAKQLSPDLPAPATVTAYHPATSATASINVVVYAPSANGDMVYNQLVSQLSQPAAESVSVPAVPVAPGASGGSLLCGSQRGATNSAWCAWKSDKGVGFLQTLGSSSQANAVALTRELRAYAER